MKYNYGKILISRNILILETILSYNLRTIEDVTEILDAPHNYNEETMEYILKSNIFISRMDSL